MNRERSVAFDEERLAIVKDRIGDVLLSTITREMIEGFQAKRKLDGVSNRTVNMDVGTLHKVLKRYGHWRRLQDHVTMLSEAEGVPIGRALTNEEQKRLLETAASNPEWSPAYRLTSRGPSREAWFTIHQLSAPPVRLLEEAGASMIGERFVGRQPPRQLEFPGKY